METDTETDSDSSCFRNHHIFNYLHIWDTDVDTRTIEIPYCTRMFKANYCLKFHNAT